jgi:hypothetical protein
MAVARHEAHLALRQMDGAGALPVSSTSVPSFWLKASI